MNDPLPLPPPCILVGTAGWSLPRAEQAEFPEAGSHLELSDQLWQELYFVACGSRW